ncbi:MAG: RluA family pseudouridine synthase [Bacteroidetes bacterium]|nr:RluA family pseudouridine synthase [Bacteroidota bacterium]
MKILPLEETTLSALLIKEFKTGSRSMVKKIILHGSVSVNGKPAMQPNFAVKPGDVVEYLKFKASPDSYDCPFPVLFEDEHVIVVEKPAGILTYGEKGTSGTSLYRELTDYLRERSKGKEKIFVVHRLDREVSGILIFAKSENIQERIKENWKETEKRYYAVVEGTPEKTEGTLENWLIEGYDKKVFVVKQERPGAKFAITHYKTLKTLETTTLLEVRLETGRKHQIRVQLSEMGYPIVGDFSYGADKKIKRRIRLHAFFFTFPHPVTGQRIELSTRMPKGFLTFGDHDEKYKW